MYMYIENERKKMCAFTAAEGRLGWGIWLKIYNVIKLFLKEIDKKICICRLIKVWCQYIL